MVKSMKTRLKKLIYTAIPVLVFLFTSLVFSGTGISKNFRLAIKQAIEKRLVSMDEWPESQTFDAMYILGGNQKAQIFKFDVASEIHNQKICRNIYFMSLDGFTEFSADLAKNLTADEWSFLKMKRRGIPSSDVMALSMERGMLGTMTEANNVAELMSQNSYTSLLLVAAPYHTQRVRLSYGHFLKNKEIKTIILGSGEPVYLRGLILEWLKLKLYEIIFMMY